MNRQFAGRMSAALLAATMFVVPVQAQSILGVVGTKDSNALITLGSGGASSNGAVNLGLGGDNLVDANILPGQGGNGAVTATVGTGGGSAVDANIGLLNGAARANVTIGGSGNGGGNGGGSGGGGGGSGGGVGGGSGNTAMGQGAGSTACVGIGAHQALQLFDRSSLSGWERASSINIVAIDLCPETRRELARLLSNQYKAGQLQMAAQSDALVATALSRSGHGANRVLAVERVGAQLTVYIY